MEPLSITASIAGILLAAKAVSKYIGVAISKTEKAPAEIEMLQTEVDTIYAIVCKLEAILLGDTVPKTSRTSMILIDQVVVSLAACVKIFSDLDSFVRALDDDGKTKFIDRLRWAQKSRAIQELLQKIQTQKSSLTLLLSILTW